MMSMLGMQGGSVMERVAARAQTLMLEGELAERELAELQDELFRLAHRGRFQVVLELSGVSHLDYRGVRPLMARAELFRRAGGDIKLAGLSGYIAAIFRAAGAHSAFELYGTAEEAAAAFATSSAEAL